ncbi:MAG: FkbM family methyltransferase, partial [Polyangiaceae bacterium]
MSSTMLARMGLRDRLAGALKPEYLFQPNVLLRRLTAHRPYARGKTLYDMPGGAQIEAEASEVQGRILATLGVIDLPVTEALWRLTDPGETCVDVGANIGYMTGILAARARGGTVHSFEALPTIFEELTANVRRFEKTFDDVKLVSHSVAVSDHAGTVRMEMPDGSETNHGLARVGENGSLEVQAVTLDEVFAPTNISVMKLDVEGHELAVLNGAERLFKEERVRDCVFEEHRAYPT